MSYLHKTGLDEFFSAKKNRLLAHVSFQTHVDIGGGLKKPQVVNNCHLTFQVEESENLYKLYVNAYVKKKTHPQNSLIFQVHEYLHFRYLKFLGKAVVNFESSYGATFGNHRGQTHLVSNTVKVAIE